MRLGSTMSTITLAGCFAKQHSISARQNPALKIRMPWFPSFRKSQPNKKPTELDSRTADHPTFVPPMLGRLVRELRTGPGWSFEVIAEVKFTEWTTAGVLRHPEFLAIVPDKRTRGSKKGTLNHVCRLVVVFSPQGFVA